MQFTYDSAGDETSVTDEVGDITTYTYDQMGRVLTEQNPVQAAASKDTAYTYDADGNLTVITDANGNSTTYTYNARNELVNVNGCPQWRHDLRLRRRRQRDLRHRSRSAIETPIRTTMTTTC